MKKVWAVLLAAALLLALTLPAMAAEIVASGTCGDDLTWTLDSEGKLTISGTGEMWDYALSRKEEANLLPPWWNYILSNPFIDINTVVICDGVTSIGDAAFSQCWSLTSVTIPNSVTGIGDFAFDDCSNLTSVTIPDSVTSIGYGAFGGTPWFQSWLQSHGDFAILNHILLRYQGDETDVTIPSSVTSIGGGAFSGCDSLTSVTIPNSVTSIGNYAFNSCDSLASVTIPDSVTSIGDDAFAWCSSMTSVTIPNSVTSIGGGAFSGCDSLTSVSIPSSVTSIGDNAFTGCTSLTSVTIPNSVTSIGSYAFEATPWLQRLGAFAIVNHILLRYQGDETDVTIPSSVTRIAGGAFSGCRSLTSVTIPSSVTSIGNDAFAWCSSLTSVTIPNSVTSIGDDAFFGCDSLTSVTIPSSVTSIGDDAFFGCDSLTSVTIPNSVTSIGRSAFSGCSSLTSVTIPNSVTSIGRSAFSGCSSLTNVTIPNSVTSIGDTAFFGCSSLTNVTIPNSVTSIGDYAFNSCDSLTDVYFTGSEQEWKAMEIGEYNDPLLNATIHFADPAPAHTHTLTHYAARTADCTQDGNVEYWACDDCGTYYADAEALRPLSADELVLPALGHDWGEWQRVKEPTETAYGRKTRTCARCGATESVLIQMLPPVTPETPTQPPQPSPEPHAFADVPESEWYVEAVNFVWDKGLMQGVSETEFAPDATADRAMLVTILHRMAEEPEAAAAAFADVDADAWFAAAVAWASETGVVSGYEDGLFHPNQPITREQLVTMLWRMAGKPGADPLETGAADWAAEAMSWAIGRGVILGDGSGYSPRRTATRAEVAAILMRCDQL